MVSEKLGIEDTFGYQLSQVKLKDIDLDPTLVNKDQYFGLNMNLTTLSLGIQFHL